MNAITRTGSGDGGNPLVPTTLDEAVRLAKIMSDMSLVPQHLHGKPADCMLIVEQAHRWRMSPFAVAQATSVLQGKLNFEGKLVAAALHTSGILSSRLRYDYEGDGPDRLVRVSASLHGEQEPREVIVRLSEVKTNNRMWTSQPDQQLSYAGARIWARRHAPEVMLGVYAPEEFDEPKSEPRHVQATVLQREAPSITDRTIASIDKVLHGDTIPALDPEPERPLPTLLDAGIALPNQPQDNAAVYASKLKRQFRDCQIIEDYNDMIQSPKVREGLQRLLDKRPELWAEVDAARQETLDRLVDQGAGGEP